MSKRCLASVVLILLAVSAPVQGEGTDNATSALGFVCRVIPSGNIAVVTPLSGAFAPQERVRFFDEGGTPCASGVVRNAYSDIAYIVLDSGSADCLKKGFVAYSGLQEEKAKAICRFSMNLPMFLEKAGRGNHTVPPNTIVITVGENTAKTIQFRHYVHDMECRKCHHNDSHGSCKKCHPLQKGIVPLSFGECLRNRCMGCHKGHGADTEECTRCHR